MTEITIKKTMIAKYLNNHFTKKDSGLEITNTRIGDKTEKISGGSYHISDTEYDSFLKLYFREVIVKKEKEYLTEKQLDSGGPILIDIDLRYDYAVKKRLHTKKHIIDIVSLYLEELKSIFQFENDTHIPVYVFEKNNVNCVESKKITKDGIHIIIGLQADHACQGILRKRVMAKIDAIWGGLPKTNTWDEVFDDGITKGHVNWQLYGSRKPNNQPYCLTYVYDVCRDPDDGEFMYNPIDHKTIETEENIILLSVRHKHHPTLFLYNDIIEECTKNTQPTKKQQNDVIRNIEPDTNIISVKNHEELTICVENFLATLQTDEFDFREAYEYTMILPKSYYEPGSFTKWIRVGWALCNISRKLFVAWIALSAKQDKFDFKDIRDLWDRWQTFDSNNINGLTKRSIMYWVREDNIVEYNKVLENSVDFHIDQTLERLSMISGDKGGITRGSGDYDIATVLYHLSKEEYVCASIKGNLWFQYQNNKWFEIDSGSSLRMSISEKLRNIYHRKGMKMLNLSRTMAVDDEKTKIIKKRIEIIASICERLSRTQDKNNIMKESKDLFHDKDFFEKLDQNPYLICFKNGIIDLKTNEFRKGRPDDFISKCTNINYIPFHKISERHIIGEINDFMTKLFPVPELLAYMWDHLASTLFGTCKEQTINMYVGIGQNGKSVLVNLMEQVLGEYKGDVPLSLLTKERTKIGGLSPELVQLKGIRYAVIQEPSKGEKINEGIMKQLTGGDPVQARAPYMVQTVTYVPQFKLVVCSNEFMEIKSQDHGTWRRIRVVPFESLFTEKPKNDDPVKPYQYILDKDIKEKFSTWKEVFASMLVHHASKTAGNVIDCDKVLAASNSYRASQDCISEFLITRIIPSEHGCLSKIVVADQFREWHNANHGGKAPGMKEISLQADKRFGTCRDGLWVGFQMKPIEIPTNED